MTTKKKNKPTSSGKSSRPAEPSSEKSTTANNNKSSQQAVWGSSKSNKDESTSSPKSKGSSSLNETLQTLQQFLKEVVIEFRKIAWPSRTEVIRETYSVIFLVAIITLMVLAFDWTVNKLVFNPLEHWARLHGGGFEHGS